MIAQPPREDDEEIADFDEQSVLDALDGYAPKGRADDADDPWGLSGPSDDDGDYVQTLLFTATNPPGTVSVTALLDGRILRVDLDPRVETLTESQLAEEISIIARMARQQARAAQHVVTLEFMRRLGHDRVVTQSYLEHELGLPSPQTVLTERAELFASRYAGEDE